MPFQQMVINHNRIALAAKDKKCHRVFSIAKPVADGMGNAGNG